MDGIMTSQPNNLEAFWMPFTANRQFKTGAAHAGVGRGHALHGRTTGGKVLDGAAGLWCVNAGHCRPQDRRGDPASRRPRLDYAPAFQMGHPGGVRAGRPA